VYGVWVPKASVRHFVVAERLTLGFLRTYFEGSGRTQVRIEGLNEAPTLFGAPRWLYKQHYAALMRSLWLRVRRDSRWLEAYLDAARARGVILEHRAWRSGNAAPAFTAH
jgi:hypothetical protein